MYGKLVFYCSESENAGHEPEESGTEYARVEKILATVNGQTEVEQVEREGLEDA